MSPDAVRSKSQSYRRTLASTGAEPRCFRPDGRGPDAMEVASHALWMLDQVPRMLVEEKVEQAAGWVRFVEGILWASGAMSFSDMARSGPSVLGV